MYNTTEHPPPLPLPEGVRSRYVDTEPWVLAYLWRCVLPKIANAGYHAVAVDQRGHGRTTSSSLTALDAKSFRLTNLARGIIVLVHALGFKFVKCIVGHDTGSLTATACALLRPTLFQSVILVSAPFLGNVQLPDLEDMKNVGHQKGVVDQLGKLLPPQKFYEWDFDTEEAKNALSSADESKVREFFYSFFYMFSAHWSGSSNLHTLSAWTVDELLRLPPFFILPWDLDMRELGMQVMNSETKE
ncbi:Alpha/Beta hydrolase protein [Aspergillus spectabilis]